MAKKVVQLSGEIDETIYTHDASGNVMAVYDYFDDGMDAMFSKRKSHIRRQTIRYLPPQC